MTGLENGIVKLSEHDAEWERAALSVIEELKDIFQGRAREIQHVGSTSIKDIAAKPIIDIAVGVEAFGDVHSLIPRLVSRGYKYRQDNDDKWQMFFVRENGPFRTHHIHVVIYGSEEWEGYIRFRNYLNSNPHRRREYEALKKLLSEKYPEDRLAYTDGKSLFIRNTLQEANAYLKLGKFTEDGQRVIAIVYEDGKINEGQLFSAPADVVLYEPEIRQIIEAGGRGPGFRLKCLFEKSCGAVLYTLRNGERLYLLVTNKSGHIGFPKGHVELGETERETAAREIYEETGLKPDFREDFRESFVYTIYTAVHKEAVYFLARFESGEINLQEKELTGYTLVNYQKALEMLNFRQDKNILIKAEAILAAGSDRGQADFK